MKLANETKPGYATTEFWVTLITLVLNNLSALPIPDRFQGWINVVLPAIYALARGLAKNGNPEVVQVHAPGSPSITADPNDWDGANDKPQA